MAEIGKISTLKVKRRRDYGAHLDGGELGDILLPNKSVPKDCRPGDLIEVFIYTDRGGRLRATTGKPAATLGQFAVLRVVAVSTAGAFLDWGLPQDLFVPRAEQLEGMEKDKSYLVHVFLDRKTNQINASSRLDKFIKLTHPGCREGDEVDIVIYAGTALGYKAIVNGSHGGMLYKNEVFRKLPIGSQLKGFIRKIRNDNKIDLSLQRPGYKRITDISQKVLQKIKDHGGRIALTDNSPPEEISSMFGVSKKSFKQAVGALYKRRLIIIEPGAIKLAKDLPRPHRPT